MPSSSGAFVLSVSFMASHISYVVNGMSFVISTLVAALVSLCPALSVSSIFEC